MYAAVAAGGRADRTKYSFHWGWGMTVSLTTTRWRVVEGRERCQSGHPPAIRAGGLDALS